MGWSNVHPLDKKYADGVTNNMDKWWLIGVRPEDMVKAYPFVEQVQDVAQYRKNLTEDPTYLPLRQFNGKIAEEAAQIAVNESKDRDHPDYMNFVTYDVNKRGDGFNGSDMKPYFNVDIKTSMHPGNTPMVKKKPSIPMLITSLLKIPKDYDPKFKWLVAILGIITPQEAIDGSLNELVHTPSARKWKNGFYDFEKCRSFKTFTQLKDILNDIRS